MVPFSHVLLILRAHSTTTGDGNLQNFGHHLHRCCEMSPSAWSPAALLSYFLKLPCAIWSGNAPKLGEIARLPGRESRITSLIRSLLLMLRWCALQFLQFRPSNAIFSIAWADSVRLRPSVGSICQIWPERPDSGSASPKNGLTVPVFRALLRGRT